MTWSKPHGSSCATICILGAQAGCITFVAITAMACVHTMRGQVNDCALVGLLQVLIAFRGTSDEFQDYWVDLNLTQADVQLKDEPELGLVEKYWNSTKLGIMRRAGVAVRRPPSTLACTSCRDPV